MPARNFENYDTSMAMRDVIDRMVEDKIKTMRPAYRYGTVTAIDRANYKCSVQLTGAPAAIQVNMGSVQPNAVGQTVRIEGMGSDKFVADVMGQPYIASATASAAGIVELATAAETATGSDSARAVTPAGLKGAVETNGLYRIQLNSTADGSLTSTAHGIQVGPTSGSNLIIDNNEVISRNNGAADTLYVNPEGAASIGNDSFSTTIRGDLRLPGSNKILWGVSAGMYMAENQTVTLSESITNQAYGIVLCWSYWSGSAPGNSFWTYTFVPKWHVQDHSAAGVQCVLSSNQASNPTMISKYVYVSNGSISGYETNNDGDSAKRVLRAVIGV